MRAVLILQDIHDSDCKSCRSYMIGYLMEEKEKKQFCLRLHLNMTVEYMLVGLLQEVLLEVPSWHVTLS